MMIQAGNTAVRKSAIFTTTAVTRTAALTFTRQSSRTLASSQAYIADFLPESVKDAVKTSVLDEMSRHDSKLWGDENAGNAIKNGTNKLNSPNGESIYGSGTCESVHDGSVSAASNEDGHGHRNGLGQQNNNIINQPISPTRLQMLHDPLDKWYLDTQPSAAPFMPTSAGSSDPFALAKLDLQTLSEGIRRDLIGSDHPVLAKAASYFFDEGHDGGKKVRPMMVLLLSRAMALHSRSSSTSTAHRHDTLINTDTDIGTESQQQQNQTMPQSKKDVHRHQHPHHHKISTDNNKTQHYVPTPHRWQRQDLFQAQKRLAEISEMIHTASLFHDDVIDGADTRRGSPSVHKVFGNKMAILAGDYLLARASIFLARLRDVEVVETMSTIIEHLVRGEVMQMRGSVPSGDTDNDYDIGKQRLVQYLRKNFYKTASLMANSCKSAAILGGYNDGVIGAAYRYGKHIGVAFQLVDDILDFDGSASVMGKPALADLHAGLATAPVLFAAEMFPMEMQPLIDRKFREEGDVQMAVELVKRSDGISRTKNLAQVHVELAIDAILELDQSVYRDSLIHLGHKVLGRTH